jgi:hypothetical protein
MNRRPIIAIDFDGTVVEHAYPGIGPLLRGAADTIRWIHTWADIILWTCRYLPEDVAEAREFLVENGIPFDRINENIGSVDFHPMPKIFFDVGIDDRNLGGLPPWSEIRKELEKLKLAWGA